MQHLSIARCIVASFLFSTGNTAVASLLTGVEADAFATWGAPDYDPPGSDIQHCSDNGSAYATCVASFDLMLTKVTGETEHFQGQSTVIAAAAYGSVVATGNIVLDSPCCEGGFYSWGGGSVIAYFSDTLTIFGPATGGTIYLTWTQGNSSTSVSQVGVTTFAKWTNGIAVPISAVVQVWPEYGYRSHNVPSLGVSTELLKVRVEDSEGQMSGFQYSTGSGVAYPVQGGTAVPEPSASSLIVCGAIVLAVRLLSGAARRHALSH
jgi:hypothetical protein